MEASEYAKRELDARNKAVADFRAIIETAGAENRDLTPEEDERIARFEAEVATRDKRITQLNGMAKAAEVVAENRHIVEAAALQRGEQDEPVEIRMAQEIRTIFQTRQRLPDREFEFRLPRVPFNELPGGTNGSFRFEYRASTTTSAIGAAIVPVDYVNRIAVYQRTLSPIIGLATVINSTSGENMNLPRLTTDVTAYAPGQGTAITASDPTITAETLIVTSYKALTLLSQELSEDDVTGLTDYIARSQARQIGLDSGSAFTLGSNGYITDGTNGGTASGTPFFTLDDLIDLEYSAAAPYRLNGTWLMANTAISKSRKFKDSNGQYLWQPSNIVGQPDTLLGHAVYEDPYLAAVASATKSVAFGDFSAYVIKQLPLRTATSTDYLFNTDQVAIKTVYRAGGALPDVAAIRFLVSNNT